MARKNIKKKVTANLSALEAEYCFIAPLAGRFADELYHQLNQLLANELVSLSFPIQHRLKLWQSISEKLQRKSIALRNISDLNDLVGLRLILQFKRDINKACDLINSNFKVLEQYDTSERLKADQFGYSSIHFIIELPEKWLAVPTLSKMKGLRAEIQLRTTAQHIWAAASHTLQYKHEDSVPPTIRRAIHRVSALLETVDLEFERVLGERELYRDETISITSSEQLNVDLLEKVLDAVLPKLNKSTHEPYSDLLDDLLVFKIYSPKLLTELVDKHREQILEEDAQRAKAELSDYELDYEIKTDERKIRLSNGVFYKHVGLVRNALSCEFGEEWEIYNIGKAK